MTSPASGALLTTQGALVASLLVGCSAPVVEGDDAGQPDGPHTVQGFVVIERTVAEGATQTSVSAKFVSLASEAGAPAALATDLVGSALWLPEVGTCAPVDDSSSLATPAGRAELPSPIRLLDVGDVTVEIRDSQAVSPGMPAISLARRAFPDVGDLISGVFYTSRDADRDLPAPASYSFESSGSTASIESPSLDGFVIEAEAPIPPALVSISGQPLVGDERRAPDGPILVEVGADLPIFWEALPAPSSSGSSSRGDVIYVDVVSATTGHGLRCTFVDNGEATLPGSMMARSHFRPQQSPSAQAGDGDLNISLHRVRTQTLDQDHAPAGLDYAEVRFDLSVVGTVTLVTQI